MPLKQQTNQNHCPESLDPSMKEPAKESQNKPYEPHRLTTSMPYTFWVKPISGYSQIHTRTLTTPNIKKPMKRSDQELHATKHICIKQPHPHKNSQLKTPKRNNNHDNQSKNNSIHLNEKTLTVTAANTAVPNVTGFSRSPPPLE